MDTEQRPTADGWNRYFSPCSLNCSAKQVAEVRGCDHVMSLSCATTVSARTQTATAFPNTSRPVERKRVADLYKTSSKYSGQYHLNLLLSSHGHRNEAIQQLAKLYPPVQFIPIIFALVLVAVS